MTTLLLLTLLGAKPAPATMASQPSPLQERIARLIAELGAADFAVRDRAGRDLLRIGLPAVPSLKHAAQDDDPEIRFRAEQVLGSPLLGVGPDWPEALAARLEGLNDMPPAEQRKLIKEVDKELGAGALPFLTVRLSLGDHDKSVRNELTACAVKAVQQKLQKRQFEAVARFGEALAKAVPEEARFPYLQAEALVALDRGKEAAARRARALGLNPATEAPHYVAGEMLGKLGRRKLAALEWAKILAMEPADGVYDINAHLRLSTLQEKSRLYGRAAASLQRALDLFIKARKARKGMGMAGASEKDVRKKIGQLHERARRSPARPNAAIRDALGERELQFSINIRVKGDRMQELRQALGNVAATVNVNVKPPGVRLFENLKAEVRFDSANSRIMIVRDGKPLGKPVRFVPNGPEARIAVASLDRYTIFRVDPLTEEVEEVDRFEKDYRLRVRPGLAHSTLQDVTVTINGKAYEWDALQKGVDLDYLPPLVHIHIKGTTPTGRQANIRIKTQPREPKIRPLRPTTPKPPVLPPDAI